MTNTHPPPSGHQSYQYAKLDHSVKETRLAELLPGSYQDDIHLKIHCTALNSSDGVHPEQSGFSVDDLQKGLPADWVVRETINGRFIFERNKDYAPAEPYETSWVHPKANFEPVANNYNLLHTKPEYEALSHVWGPKEDQTTVYIRGPISVSAQTKVGTAQNSGVKRKASDDGPLPDAKRKSSGSSNNVNRETNGSSDSLISTLPIQSDLAIALRHLRLKNRSRMLWVDNICINQDDTSERSNLVRHMGQIYRLAQKVIVWIGPEDNNSRLAMAKLEYLGRQVEITNKGSYRVNAPACLEPTWSRTVVPLPYDSETWDAITSLLQRPWFRRLWVWQEAKLSNDESILQCGQRKMELYRFGAATWCAAAKRSTIPRGLQKPLSQAGDAVLRQFDEPFLNTLLHLNHKECSDPRDKIYGALGLAPPQVADKIEPDYTKEVEEVYTDAVVALCEATGRIDFLLACDLGNRVILGPTWAPDWSVEQRLSPRWLLSATLASGISISNAEVIYTPKPTLLVQGVECGTICAVGETAPDEGNDLGQLDSVIRSWAPSCLEEETYIDTDESLLDAFVKTVHWNTLQDRCPLDQCLLTLAEARQAIQAILTTTKEEPETAEQHEKRKNLYLTRYREALGRAFITLDNGYIGMTSMAAEETDIVCVILGCPLPMILRPHSSGRYQVVGSAYIHGLMDAEAVLGRLPSDYRVEVGASAGWYGGYTFRHLPTDTVTTEDPRLDGVSSSWVRIEGVRTSTDPLHFVRYRDLATGKTINGDPRLLPEALRARGKPLKPLKLV